LSNDFFASTINYVSSHVIVCVLEVLEFRVFWYWLVLSSTTSLWDEPLQTLVWTSGVLKLENSPLEGLTAITDQMGHYKKTELA
jgi:hypothetical protein